MYAVNMVYCHWLIKKLLLANDLTEYSQTERKISREDVESGRSHGAARGERHELPAGTWLVGTSHVEKYKILEMG